MTRDEAKKLLPVIQAFSDGKDVEWRQEDGTWSILREPLFAEDAENYRIKPEPLERWILIDCDGCVSVYKSQSLAEDHKSKGAYAPYTIHHMREVI